MYERQPQGDDANAGGYGGAGGGGTDYDYYTARPVDLVSLNNSDWQVVEGEPDIRGWMLVDHDGVGVGYINDLLVSPQAMQAVFAVVGQNPQLGAGRGGGGGAGTGAGGTAGGGATGSAGSGTYNAPAGMPDIILVPMDRIQLDMANRRALFQGSTEDLVSSPPYAEGAAEYGLFYNYWAGRRMTGTEQAAATAPATSERQTVATPAETKAQTSAPPERETHEMTVGEQQVIPEVEEHLDVAKKAEQTGTVEVHKEVEIVPETVHATVKRTRIYVSEEAVEPHEVRPGEQVLREGETIEIPIVEEELVVEKRPRVTREVVIRPETVEEEKEVTAQVRKEHVKVEAHGDVDVDETRGESAGQPGS